MATLHQDESGRVVAYVKGAVERLLGMAAHELRANGLVTAVDAAAVHACADELAGRALRVLAMGRVELPAGTTALTEQVLDGRVTPCWACRRCSTRRGRRRSRPWPPAGTPASRSR